MCNFCFYRVDKNNRKGRFRSFANHHFLKECALSVNKKKRRSSCQYFANYLLTQCAMSIIGLIKKKRRTVLVFGY